MSYSTLNTCYSDIFVKKKVPECRVTQIRLETGVRFFSRTVQNLVNCWQFNKR